MIETITYLLYIFSFLFSMLLFYQLLYKSEYGILVFFTEFFTFIIPICIYPLFFYLDIFDISQNTRNLIQQYGRPGIIEAFHVLLYVLAAFTGYQISAKQLPSINNRFHRLSKYIKSDKLFYRLILFGLITYAFFYLLVGVENVFLHASAARSGFVDNYGENQKYLFLVTLAKVSLYAVCFLPWIFYKQKTANDKLFLFLYFVLLVATYFANYGRGMWLAQLIIPLIVYARLKTSFSQFLKLVPVFLFGYLVLIYGKSFGNAVSLYFQGESVSSVSTYSQGDSVLETFFNNSSYAWFSIRAGVVNFFSSGPLLPKDVIFSTWGFVPTNIMESLGLGFLNYSDIPNSERLPCINSEFFLVDKCTVPPATVGYSAYLMPFVGAILIGFVKYYLIGVFEKMWLLAKRSNYYLTCIPYFLLSLTLTFFSMIPTHISVAFFTMYIIVIILIMKKLIYVRV